MMITAHISMPAQLRDRLRRETQRTGIGLSEMVRRWAEDYLEGREDRDAGMGSGMVSKRDEPAMGGAVATDRVG